MMHLMLHTPHHILFRWSNQEDWNGLGVLHVWGGGEVNTGSRRGTLREEGHFEDPGIDGRIILKWIFKKRNKGHALDQSGPGEGQVVVTAAIKLHVA
jgi:hypothetical protein